MEKINAFIVDDEVDNIKLLEHFIKKNCPMIELIGSALSFEESVEQIDKLKPELLFLDIVLNEKTGFDVLEAITHEKLKVIFVTAYNEYAIKAFKYNAIDYLMKPIDIDELIAASDKAYEDIQEELFTERKQLEMASFSMNNVDKFDFIAIPSMKKVKFINLKDLIYLESEGRYTTFYLKDGNKIISSKNLGEYESFLGDYFFRIHNRYIINLRQIRYIDKSGGIYCMMNSGKLLPVAKRRQNLLNKHLNIK